MKREKKASRVGWDDGIRRGSRDGSLGEVTYNQSHVRKMRSHRPMKSVNNQRVLGILNNMCERPNRVKAWRVDVRLLETGHSYRKQYKHGPA